MQALNLPAFPFKITEDQGRKKIFDPIRRKYLVLTPEEWVRQHFLQYLIIQKGFPAGRFQLEVAVKHSQTIGRFDALSVDDRGNPLLLLECKAPDVKISQETFYQIARYNGTLKAKALAVTNGLQHYFLLFDLGENKFNFVNDLPEYQYLVNQISKP